MCFHTDRTRTEAQAALSSARHPPDLVKGTPDDFSGPGVTIMVCADCGQPVELRRSLILPGAMPKALPVLFKSPA